MTSHDVLVPDPFLGDKQYHRFYHLDLSELGDIELTDELHHLRPLLWGLPPTHWLRDRVAVLEAEIIKRQGDTGRKFSKRLKPKSAEGVTL